MSTTCSQSKSWKGWFAAMFFLAIGLLPEPIPVAAQPSGAQPPGGETPGAQPAAPRVFSPGDDPREAFPRSAPVTQEGALVRSGPGDQFYPTSRLTAGTTVEIHGREPGGWLAIRPPAGSFSWVAANQLRLQPQNEVATAVGAARSWIGTELERLQKHRWQVELRPGEPVQLLGERQWITPSGDVADTWYRIAPPAGEFRYIHERELQGSPTGVVAATEFTPRALGEPIQFETASPVPATTADGRPPVASPGLPANAPTGPAPASTDPAGAGATGADLGPGPTSDTKLAPAPAGWTPPADPEEFERLLESLDAETSLRLTKPVAEWRLGDLLNKVQLMAHAGPTALHRGQASRLLDTLRTSEQLRLRQAALDQPPAALAGGGAPSSSGTQSPGGAPQRDATSAEDAPLAPVPGGFDAVGWLMPLESAKGAAPPYAVLDDNGKILQLVTPAPGLKLDRFLRSKVGLNGQRGQITTLDMPHLTAQRVIRLQKQR